MKIKVIEWISEKDCADKDVSIGGLGGWFNFNEKGKRWKDYLDATKKELHPYCEAIRKSVIEKKLRTTGDQHQHSGSGVPLFNDDTIGSFSYRAWGDLMAAIWSEEEDKDYNYMDFYM